MRKLTVTLATLFCALAAGTSLAYEQGDVYVSPGVLYYYAPESDETGSEGGETGVGGILGFPINDDWAVELLSARADVDYEFPAGTGTDKADLLWFNVLYTLGSAEKWKTFATLGGGRTKLGFDEFRSDLKDTQTNLGVGFFRNFSQRIALRGDLRAVHSNKEGGVEPFAFLGLTAYLGSMTPPPPPDSDGDGVPDADDRCPNTPPGTDVGPDGCERDSDGDGVVDSADQCPGTPAGVKVDERGCPLDSDGDGVPDYQDACPDTPAGSEVDARGCPPEPEPVQELTETITIDMNLEFDTDSAALRSEHYPKITDVLNFMQQFPGASAVIEGHTDNTGSESYNQGLSERRANSVRSYLIQEGIGAGRLSSVGYGESRPIDTNDTEEGRQHNRRVSAKVSGAEVNQ